jgi:hypothetical protein
VEADHNKGGFFVLPFLLMALVFKSLGGFFVIESRPRCCLLPTQGLVSACLAKADANRATTLRKTPLPPATSASHQDRFNRSGGKEKKLF